MIKTNTTRLATIYLYNLNAAISYYNGMIIKITEVSHDFLTTILENM